MLRRQLACTGFVAHGVDPLRRRADKARTGIDHALRKARVLREKTIARMQAIGVRLFEDLDNQILVEITLARGRWADARQPNEKELKATTIIALEIESASAKTRAGAPGDDGEDLEFPVWAGVIPLPVVPQAGERDPKQTVDYPVPDYVADYRR